MILNGLVFLYSIQIKLDIKIMENILKNLIIIITLFVTFYLTDNLYLVVLLFFLLSYLSSYFPIFFKKSNNFKQDEENTLKLKKMTISKFFLGLGLFSQTDEFDHWKNSNLDLLNQLSDELDLSLDELIKFSLVDDNDNFISKMEDDNFISSTYSSINIFASDDLFNSFTSYIDINPATGLPIIGNSGVDVGGNPYGLDLNDQFENSFDHTSYDNHIDHSSYDDFKF